MKKALALILSLCLILGAAGALADTVTLRYAEVNPIDTPVGMIGTFFKEKVEELSGGSVIVDIQAGGVLGTEAQILDGIFMGGDTVDLMRISAFALSSYGCNKAKMLSLPYTFVSREHYWNFANSDLAKEFLNEPQEIGLPLRGLCYGEEGLRHFFSKVPINTIEDLKGLKIRVSEDPVMTGMVKGLGANPANVSFTELYSALQTGVVDAAEQPIANYKSNAFPEVAPYMILDGHTLGAVQIVITDNGWAKLTEEQQNAIMEAAKLTQEYNASFIAEAEQKVQDELIAAGYTVIEVEDKTPWVEACSEVTKENIKGYEDLYQQLVDLQ
ncbi:MAG: TRAP transporter substrate-binding protein [Clostridia bacterium]|nr:TRAP transporter substrate-binding protein [Clostridia bacterium]